MLTSATTVVGSEFFFSDSVVGEISLPLGTASYMKSATNSLHLDPSSHRDLQGLILQKSLVSRC